MKRTLLVGVAVALAVVVGLSAGAVLGRNAGPGAGDPGQAAPGQPRLDERVDPERRSPLPDATLDAFSGDGTVSLTAYRGTPLIVNLWASWCAPCVAEMPEVQQVAQQVAPDVAVLGVNVRDAPSNARAFVERLGITYDLAVDPHGELYTELRAYGMPTTLLVDAAGTIVYRHTGPLDADELLALVRERLGGP